MSVNGHGMAEKHSYPSSERLQFLLNLIHNRAMALPDFQRDFVWDPAMTDELIESVMQNFPCGTLLQVKNGQELLFKPRAFAGAPELNQGAPTFLVLDGQQRLTSLYQAFYGAGSHRFMLDLAGLEQDLDLEDCSFYDRAERLEKRFGTIQQQASSLVFPLARLFGSGGFDKWLSDVLRARATNANELLSLQERLTAVRQRWLRPIEEYEFPMVTISEKASATAICTIFETLNRTGVKLSVFDLLTARFWPHDVKLRDLWEIAESQHPILQEFSIDPYYVLQIIALFEPGTDKGGQPRPSSVKRADVLGQTPEQAGAAWPEAVAALSEVLGILQDDCGVMVARWLPYSTIVIPAAAAWAKQKRTAKGPIVGANRAKLVRWFWCATLGQRYEYAVNSQTAKDYTELVRWMTADNSKPPDSVAEFTFHSGLLRTTTPRQRSLYRTLMALVLRNQPRDFHKRGLITPAMFNDSKNPVDDHHIFPAGYLAPLGIPTAVRDGILNRTLIDRQTNIRIGMRAPADYLSEIRKEWESHPDFEGLLASHLLPGGEESPLFTNDLQAFLAYREDVLVAEIERVTGISVSRDSEEEPTAIPRDALELTALRTSAPAPTTPEQRDVDAALVRRAFSESADAMRRFLSYLADNPSRLIPNHEIAESLGVSRPQLAGMLGAFGRRWANRYAQADGKWFFDAQWRIELGTEEWKWHYGVTDEVAGIIRSVESEARSETVTEAGPDLDA